MDRILTAETDLLEANFGPKSTSIADNDESFLECLSTETRSQTKDENRLGCQISNREMEMSHIRRASCDDIISKELPTNILDTDFEDKAEENSLEDNSDLLHLADSSNTTVLNEKHESPQQDNSNENLPTPNESYSINIDGTKSSCENIEENTSNAVEEADIVASTDSNDDEKSDSFFKSTNDSDEVCPCQTDSNQLSSALNDVNDSGKGLSNKSCDELAAVESVQESESATAVSLEPADADKSIQTVDSSSSPPNEQNIDGGDNSDGFVPTIIDIRGACNVDTTAGSGSPESSVTSTLETPISIVDSSGTSQLPQINIVHIQGNCSMPENDKKSEKVEPSQSNTEVHTIDDDDDGPDRTDLTSSYNPELDIKQEPQENMSDDDCMYSSAETGPNCFTSEIFIEEEKAGNENEEDEIIYIETSSRIPSPILIKLETNVDSEEQFAMSRTKGKLEEKKMSPLENSNSNLMEDHNQPVESAPFSAAGYTCHLCNTTFQEHERLNEHMKLHRNNMVDTKIQSKSKQKEKNMCPHCNRQLSTWQALQQHVMIHNDEKPHKCSLCKKGFRHISNYKMHMKKHEMDAQQTVEREKLKAKEGSSARAFNFGKLVGPLFMKETLLGSQNSSNQELRKMTTSKSVFYTKDNTPTKLSFDTLPFRGGRDNTKENLNVFNRSLRNRVVDDADDDIIPLKTFNNVENIVMNAARFIVKVDNIDPNILKRRIKTPDISIDRNSASNRRVGEKRKIILPPPDKNKRLKLDQIENIIMDDEEPFENDASLNNEFNDQDFDYDNGDDYDLDDGDDDDVLMTGTQKNDAHGTLTDNELYTLLNDSSDRENHPKNKTQHHDYESELRRNAQMIFKTEAEKSMGLKFDNLSSFKNSDSVASPRASNVIILKPRSPSHQVTSPTSTKWAPESDDVHTVADDDSSPSSDLYLHPWAEMSDDECDERRDSFDKVFHRVAMRRLLMIQKRAARNEGKVNCRYLLGPLFWRKALRRAKAKPVNFEAKVPSNCAPTRGELSDKKFSKLDERRTNDPAKLQVRAENKLSCILNRMQISSNFNDLNLIGPLFWKKTLKLAGVHGPTDLKMLMNDEQVSLQDVQFVSEDELIKLKEERMRRIKSEENEAIVNNNALESTAAETNVFDLLHSLAGSPAETPAECSSLMPTQNAASKKENMRPEGDDTLNDFLQGTKLNGHIQSAQHTEVEAEPSRAPPGSSESLQQSAHTGSILYDSLTKPQQDSSLATSSEGSTTLPDQPVKPEKMEVDDTVEETNSEVTNAEPAHPNPTDNLAADISDGTSAHANGVDVANFKTETNLTESGNMEKLASDIVDSSADAENLKSECDNMETYSDCSADPQAAVGNTNLLLNAEGNLQLITTDDEKSAGILQDGSNYVLVSDESGAMQLVKESDLHLVEGSDTTSAHYVVNSQGENYGNFELVGDANGDQLTYALQFDGENYTAVQFVQNSAEVEEEKQKLVENNEEEKVLKPDTEYVMQETPAPDLNNIGKELSDFLNLDYGTLLKNDDGSAQT